MCVKIRDEILFGGGGGGGGGENLKPEKIQFYEKGQNGHFGKNLKIFYISDDEKDFTVGIVS